MTRGVGRGALFQRSSSKTSSSMRAHSLSSRLPSPISLIASVLIAYFFLIFAPFGLSEAQAVTCPATSSYVLPIKGLILTVNEAATANNVGIPNACFGQFAAWYTQQMVKAQANSTASSINSFTTRMTSCMKGQSASIWSPASYLNWSRCTITVSFVPTSQSLATDFNTVKSSFNSHVPTAYISYVVTFFSTISTNWGTTACTAQNLDFQFKPLRSSRPLDFAIPCTPPSPLKALRYLMVIGVWSMVVFFIYRETLSFMDKVIS